MFEFFFFFFLGGGGYCGQFCSMRVTQCTISSPHILQDLFRRLSIVGSHRCKRDLSKVKDEVNSLTVWVPSELPDLCVMATLCIDL